MILSMNVTTRLACAAAVLGACGSPSVKHMTQQEMIAADPLPLAKGATWTYNVVVKRFDAFSRGIESTGCGLSRLRAIEAKEAKAKPPWHEAIAAATVPLATAITKAVAEWVDGDTVAAHYAYANDYICTTNAGVGGAHSIMSTQNRDTVLRRINIRFIGPDELAAMLAKF